MPTLRITQRNTGRAKARTGEIGRYVQKIVC